MEAGGTAIENLEVACAKKAREIAAQPSKELEKLLTEALDVLEEQGVYALFLFLKTQDQKIIASNTRERLCRLLEETPRGNPLLPGGDGDVLELISKTISKDLDRLLLCHDLLRQTLVFARYHARLEAGEEVSP